MWRRIRMPVVLTIGAAGLAAASDEGTRRSVRFWRITGPIYLHYRWTQYQLRDASEEEADREWNRLHDKYSPVIRENILKLKGFYLKNAQLMATQDQFVPPQYLEVCKQMQDQVPTEFVPGQAKQLIEEQLKRPLDEVFVEFDDTPVGAASIGERQHLQPGSLHAAHPDTSAGQVHRAKLKATGQEVAIKLQYPGIERKFRADLATMIWFSMPEHVSSMEQIQKQFTTEFDYVAEAQSLDEIGANLQRGGFGDRIETPTSVRELCTRTMLVMTYLPGVKLVDGLRAEFRQYAAQRGISAADLEAEEKAVRVTVALATRASDVAQFVKQCQAHPQGLAAYDAKMRMYARLQRIGDLASNALRFVFNWSAGWLMTPYAYVQRRAPINLAAIIKLLNEVHAHEILVDGVFNGDPHPGNILLTPSGRLGLIDYGQIQRVDDAQRLLLAELVLALADDRRKDIVRLMRQMGARTKYNLEDVQYRLTCFWFDRNSDDITEGRNLPDFFEWMEKKDPMVQVAEQALMAARVSILLRGVGNAFGLQFRTSTLWAPIARRVLDQQNAQPRSQ